MKAIVSEKKERSFFSCVKDWGKKLPESREKAGQVEKNSVRGGFTFVETLAVLAVTAILASQISVAAFALIQRGKRSVALSQLENFRVALQSYYIDCGRFPTDEQGLEALWTKPVLFPVSENWNGPYTDKKIGTDPWGFEYEYFAGGSARMPSDTPVGLPFAIMSYGADGKEGGTGNEKDIVSWQ